MSYNWKKYQVFDKKYLFIHIHKTGGSSVKNFFNNDKHPSHSKVSDIIKEIGEQSFNKYIPFTVIRHPFDRTVSGWAYMTGSGRMSDCNFKEYVKDGHFKHFLPQYKYLIYNNNLKVNNIIRYENLKMDLNQLLIKYNLNYDIKKFPHSRKSQKRKSTNYKDYFTEELEDIVYGYYKDDFINFNYLK